MSRKWDSDFIAFSRNSRVGVIVILILFFFVAIAPRLYGYFFWQEPAILEKEMVNHSSSNESALINIDTIAPFDPNDLDVKEWMRLGLSEKQANSVMNWKDKIGGFNDAKMLQKAYAISDEFYESIVDKLIFPNRQKNNLTPKKTAYEKTSQKDTIQKAQLDDSIDTLAGDAEIPQKVEINSASFEDLIAIKGIGNYFAERIIDLRIQSGGFTSIEQLLEIKYFNEENLQNISPYVFIDVSEIRKIDINTATLKQLSRHPEITWEMARSIIDLRNDLGKFSSLDELLLSAHIDLRRYKKLNYYLTTKE